ncbi:hypothetical protein GE09DRAFT_1072918 [Coniochaeta sp. 2T2.1]|nr:hypothetical protein GE09DRAFT_1072918 [Coniochaeta sp. 2T2.1]
MILIKPTTAARSRIVRTITATILPSLSPPHHPAFRAASAFRSPTLQGSNPVRRFTTLQPLRSDNNMASDEEYMNFLDKANEDPSKGVAKSQSHGLAQAKFKTTDAGVEIPAALKEVTKDAFYVSDADEPFVPVALSWDEAGKGLPDEEEIARLINHPDPANAEVEILDPVDWDTQGQYKNIIDAVTKAGKGNDVRVYKISKGGVRVEYWVVTTEGEGKGAKLVGVKALAVES